MQSSICIRNLILQWLCKFLDDYNDIIFRLQHFFCSFPSWKAQILTKIFERLDSRKHFIEKSYSEENLWANELESKLSWF